MVAITQERMDYVSHVALMPIALLINFSLCQYLIATFYDRRQEPRIRLLLGCAVIGFVSIIPFSHPDDTVFEYLDDISEAASTLTFLLQIVVLGRDINKKVRIKSLVHMTRAAEALVGVEIAVLLACIVKLCDQRLAGEWINTIAHAVKDVALWFVVFARFYYISMARGLKKTLVNKRFDIFLYLLFATHEYPFLYLEAKTHISWQPVVALWYRLTIMMCILQTIKDKVRSVTSKQLKTGLSQGTATKHSAGRSEHHAMHDKKAPSLRTLVERATAAKAKGPSSRSLNKIGVSFRSVVPMGTQGQ